MPRRLAPTLALCLLAGCSGSTSGTGGYHPSYPETDPGTGPAAGWADGGVAVPAEGLAEDVSSPDHVVGTGTPESCTAQAFTAAVALGGKITFACGAAPVTIRLTSPAEVYNDRPDVVIDGGGLVTLSGSNTSRILYMNTCDQRLVWTTAHCQNQDSPHLTVQNLTFVDGNTEEISEGEDASGGGAIWVRGGRFKVVNCRFFNNRCATLGSDLGGGAIRVFSQYENRPVYVVHSTFGGAAGYGNSGASGGAISSIGVSWSIYNSVFSYNTATGTGANSGNGGNGGAIYNDGNTMTLDVEGCLLEHDTAGAFGAAIFFVSNDGTGTLRVERSTFRSNSGDESWHVMPGIALKGHDAISDTTNTFE